MNTKTYKFTQIERLVIIDALTEYYGKVSKLSMEEEDYISRKAYQDTLRQCKELIGRLYEQ